MKHLLLIAAAMTFLMAGCVSVQKQRNRAELFYLQHPEELAAKCAANFPPSYKQGQTITLPGDTVYVKGDSVKCPDVVNPVTGEKTQGAKVKCPDNKTIYIPQLRVDTVESTALLAKVKQQELEVKRKGEDLTKSKQETIDALKTAENRLWIIIGLGSLIALYGVGKYLLKFKFL